ncbi:MAG TPA: hypothetical protein VEF06_05925 [Bryobacteraceae bacterium]|nr:hypothetical protein [Bryobacteraceae bacterium]
MHVVEEDVTRSEIDRILQSDTFRSSDVLRRLFRFLADKSIAGEADQLKEYTIGLDAFGKPPSYDPRSDAIVRLQAGRLRQKLAEYYRTEGKDDPVVVDLPKGHFKLTWQARPAAADIQPAIDPAPVKVTEPPPRRRWLIPLLGAALLLSLAWNIRSAVLSRTAAGSGSALWTPELHELWDPFISDSRPLLVAFADPMFVGVIGRDGNVLGQLRLTEVNDWNEAATSPPVQALRRAMGNLTIAPRFNFAGRGYLDSALRLGKLLGTRQSRLSVARLSQISWQSLSDNNALLVDTQGSAPDDRLLGLPVKPELMLVREGVRNLHPRPGEPAVFTDTQPATVDGEILALVSVVPGPVGITRVGAFTSNRFWGNAGAIESFTDPAFARLLVEKLKGPSGKFPAYYQVLLKVKYRDGVPTDVSYITHRDLPALPVAPPRHD